VCEHRDSNTVGVKPREELLDTSSLIDSQSLEEEDSLLELQFSVCSDVEPGKLVFRLQPTFASFSPSMTVHNDCFIASTIGRLLVTLLDVTLLA
jgi:hypothetical protein